VLIRVPAAAWRRSWHEVNARILPAAIATLAPGSAATPDAALPAWADLTAAVGALAGGPLD
jgi:hypothetical protein